MKNIFKAKLNHDKSNMSIITISILISMGIWILLFTYSADFLNFVVFGDENKLLENVNVIAHEINLESANYDTARDLISYSKWTHKIVDRTLFALYILLGFLLILSIKSYNQFEFKIVSLLMLANGIVTLVYNWVFLLPAKALSAKVGIYLDPLLVLALYSVNFVVFKGLYSKITGKSLEVKSSIVILTLIASYIELLAFRYLTSF